MSNQERQKVKSLLGYEALACKAGISNLILKLAEILLGHCLNVLQWDLFFLNVPLYKI